MILLDTHVWVWWGSKHKQFTQELRQIVYANIRTGLGVSVVSCWEVAKLVSKGKLQVELPINEWVSTVLNYPGVQLTNLTPQIAIESTRLPGDFHRDPADQIIVATARIYEVPLLTVDTQILAYPHVTTVI